MPYISELSRREERPESLHFISLYLTLDDPILPISIQLKAFISNGAQRQTGSWYTRGDADILSRTEGAQLRIQRGAGPAQRETDGSAP